MTRVLISFAALLILFTVGASAQVRPAVSSDSEEAERTAPAVLPKSIATEYQGGIYGFSEKEKGTIKFDELNERLVFFGEDGKEKFSIPYEAIVVVYPSKKKVQSGTGRAIGAIPFPGASLGGAFLKKQKNYLVIQYLDPDVDIRGTVNFLIDTGDELFAAIHAVGQNAELQRRGDAYIRKKTY